MDHWCASPRALLGSADILQNGQNVYYMYMYAYFSHLSLFIKHSKHLVDVLHTT